MALQQSKNHTAVWALLFSLIVILALSADLASAQSDWKAIKMPNDETITGIHFPTPKDGYYCTSGGKVGISHDGGLNWQVFRINTDAVFEEVHFKSKDTGLIVGREGHVYRTVDGGKSWEDRRLDDTLCWLTSGMMLNDTIALVVGLKPGTNMEGVIYRSTNGCIDWQAVDLKGAGFGELYAGKSIPVCFQSFGKLNYSTDLGATWKSLETLNGKPGRATAFFYNTGVICGNGAMCGVSSDRGKSWRVVALKGEADLTTAVLASDSLGYVGGTGGIIMFTTDGGKKWEMAPPLPVKVDIAKLAVNGNRLFAVGASGFLFHRDLPK